MHEQYSTHYFIKSLLLSPLCVLSCYRPGPTFTCTWSINRCPQPDDRLHACETDMSKGLSMLEYVKPTKQMLTWIMSEVTLTVDTH